MKIKDLLPGMPDVSISGKVVSKGEPRNVVLKRGGEGTVADVVIEDESGRVTLSLWNEQISRVNEGDTVEVQDGYTTTFRSELRLNVGKYGKLAVNRGTEP